MLYITLDITMYSMKICISIYSHLNNTFGFIIAQTFCTHVLKFVTPTMEE